MHEEIMMEGEYLEKHVLQEYSDALARVKLIRKSIESLAEKIKQITTGDFYVSDSVTRGKKGKKSLGTVTIKGIPYPEYFRKKETLRKRWIHLEKEEMELLELTSMVEEYIFQIQDIEIRNIMSLYYIDDLNWLQVAHRMNEMYEKKRTYTESSCRRKHDRFLEKN